MTPLKRYFHCERKRQFPTEEAALAVRSLRIARSGPSWRGVIPYRCAVCSSWHLGHPKIEAAMAAAHEAECEAAALGMLRERRRRHGG